MPFSGGVSQFTLGDINGDGLLDIAWYEQAETKDLHNNLRPRAYRYALANSSSGSFSWTPSYTSPALYDDMQLNIVDLNNDGRAEVIAGQGDRLTTIMYLDINSDGLVDRLSSQYQRPWVNYYWQGAAALRLGKADTALSPSNEHYYAQRTHTPLKQIFASNTHIPSYADAMAAIPETWYLKRDANGQIILNNLHLSPIHSLTGLTGDVDGDGRMDIVAYAWTNHGLCYQDNDYDHCEWENSVPVLYSMQQAASGQFELVYKDGFHIVPDPAYAFMIDLNGDGLSDIVYARGHDDWAFRLSNGVSFEEPVAINIPGRAFYSYNRDNTDVTLADFNGDGYPDIIWHSPNAPFSNTTTGTGSGTIKVKYWDPTINRFSDNEVILRAQGYNILTNYSDPRFGWDYRSSRFKTSAIQMVDVNADGKPDLLITPTTQGGSATIYLGLTPEQPENTIIAIHKGLGDSIEIEYEALTHSVHYARGDVIQNVGAVQHCTDIADSYGSYTRQTCWDVSVGETTAGNFYRNLNDPWHKLSAQQQSLRPKEPTFAKAGAMYVVTGVSTSAPVSNDNEARYHTAYFYEQARLQASGRGFLGFEYFTMVDRETGIRTRQQYRQDWPYTSKLWRTEVFTAEGHKLGATETTYGVVQCYSNGIAINSCVNNLSNTLATQGSAALGPLQLFAAEQTERSWALSDNGYIQGVLLKETLTRNQFDGNGNNIAEHLTIRDGYGGIQKSVVTEREFDKNGSTWSMQQGRLKRLQVTSTNDQGSISRVSEFDYYGSGSEIGLLKTETIEPDNSEYKVTTTHSYSNGNLVLSTMVTDGQTRIKDIRYDNSGRYINETYELFSNGSNPNTGTSRRTYSVAARDRYGAPTTERFYTGTNTYITRLTGTTTFGSVYFTSDSSGYFSEMDAGLGAGTDNICPAGTVSWRKQQDAGDSVSLMCLDKLQRVIREGIGGFTANTWRVTDTERDKRGLVSRTSAPYMYSQETPFWTSYQHDMLGRVTQTVNSINNGTSAATNIRYDGYQTTTVNGLSQQRTDTFNALGQLEQVTDPNNGVTTYRYDARGNLVHMADPAGNATQIQYDLRDRKISMEEPNKGSWSYKYNRFNELVCQQDAKGQITLQKYDLLGRLFSRTEYKAGGDCGTPTGSVEKFSRWEYDTAVNGLGKLQRIYDSTAINGSAQYQQSYSYDTQGRLSVTTTRMPGHLNQMGDHYEKITYDQYGRIFQQFDAARSSNDFNVNGVEYRYSETGYLQQLVDSVNRNGRQQAFYTIQQMDALGNVTNAEYANGVTMQHDYYRDSGLAKVFRSYAITGGSTELQQLELIWDEIGNLQSRHETGSAGELTRRNVRESFQYDNLNQLTRWQTTGELALTETASISGIGNILSKSGVGNYKYGSSCSHSSNAGPNAVCQAGSTTYVYDNNGALISDSSGRTMQYTVSNLLSEVAKGGHTTRFNYSPLGQRYKRTDIAGNQTTTTLYLGSVEKVYYPDSTIEWKRNIAGVGLFSQKVNGSGTVLEERQRYQVQDHLGSVSLITDEIGLVEQVHYFDPWGQARKIVSNGSNKGFSLDEPFRLSLKPITTRGFTGHEQLDETGLIHMNGRVYDARLGRFIQADPLIQDPTKVQSLNRYSYVWNNPLNATDPSGFACEGTACMDTRPEDNKPIERIIVRGTQPDSAMQRHHEAMQRHLRNMVMEGISQNAMSESIQAGSSEALKDMHHEAREWERVPGRNIKWSKLTSAERKHIRKILQKTKGNLNKLKNALRSDNTATKDKIAQHYGLSGANDADYGYLADGLEALVTDIVGKIDGVLSKADLNGVFRSTGNNHGEYMSSTGGVYYEQKFFESSEASQIGTTAHEFGHAFGMDHHRTMTKERFMNEDFSRMRRDVLYIQPGDPARRDNIMLNIKHSYFLESAIDRGVYD